MVISFHILNFCYQFAYLEFHAPTDPNFSWVVRLKEFAHPAVETFSAVGTSGPTFFLAIAMFGFVFQISSLITEKELKLRQVFSFSDALVFEGKVFFFLIIKAVFAPLHYVKM